MRGWARARSTRLGGRPMKIFVAGALLDNRKLRRGLLRRRRLSMNAPGCSSLLFVCLTLAPRLCASPAYQPGGCPDSRQAIRTDCMKERDACAQDAESNWNVNHSGSILVKLLLHFDLKPAGDLRGLSEQNRFRRGVIGRCRTERPI